MPEEWDNLVLPRQDTPVVETQQRLEEPLPDMVVDYLDLLLQDATEPVVETVPEGDRDAALEAALEQVLSYNFDALDQEAETDPRPAPLADLAPPAVKISKPRVAPVQAPQARPLRPEPQIFDRGFGGTFDTAGRALQALARDTSPPASMGSLRGPWTETFTCLKVRIGIFTLLVPTERVRRVEPVVQFRRYQGVCVPELPARDYLLLVNEKGPGIYIDKVEGVERVGPEEVVWRRASRRCPWYVGTHKTLLCRVFDPLILLNG